MDEVSVIIPTYNRAPLISRAVDSVLTQTYRDCHVIVVDDGSTDTTASVIGERYGANPRVRYLHQRNGGVSAARNAGLAVARGGYIAFLDSDDTWRPWKLAVQVACLEQLRAAGVGMLWSDLDLVDDGGAVTLRNANRSSYGAYRIFSVEEMFTACKLLEQLVPDLRDPGERTRVFWGDVYSHIIMGNLCAPSSVIMSRERAQQVGGFDESMRSGEDHDFHLRACALGPVAFLDVATVSYRKGAADQLTHEDYQLVIAQNALRTLTTALKTGRGRIQLPREIIDQKIASVHAWIGRILLAGEDRSSARAHLASSIRHRPRQPRVWALLAAACLPRPVTDRVLASYRRVTRRK